MKRINLLCLCFLGSFALMQAQNSSSSNEAPRESSVTVEDLLVRTQEIGTVSGSVSDYFTTHERRLLRDHFKGVLNSEQEVITHSESQGNEEMAGVGDAMVYGINNDTEQLMKFEVDNPDAFTELGASAVTDFESAGAVDPNSMDVGYVLDDASNFFRVHLDTGTYDRLGSIWTPGSEKWSGAEFDPVSGQLYAISTNVSESTLSLINIADRTRTTVGVTGIPAAVSLIIDDAGNGYAHDIQTDKFYAIDLATGASTVIGDLGFDANYSQGGCWIAGDPGYVYLSAFNSDNMASEWRRLDVTDGSSTVVGVFNGGDDQVGWSSPKSDFLNVEDSKLEGFTFSPNPTTDMLSLQSVDNIDSVVLFNILGQRVLHTKVNATSTNLNLSGLAAGPYIMKVSVDGQVGTYKIMKN